MDNHVVCTHVEKSKPDEQGSLLVRGYGCLSCVYHLECSCPQPSLSAYVDLHQPRILLEANFDRNSAQV